MVFLALLLTAFPPALAQGFFELGGFKTPSGNIHCFAYVDRLTQEAVLRCDLLQNEARIPAKPKDCPLDWGNAFGLSERGPAGRLCVGDTVADPRLPVLAYGKVWSEGGFRCDVTQARLRCINKDKRGFELSRSLQRLF
ncbi:MAG: hypothetical protein RMK51_12970 [Meiothermus sp.]|uniref:DUF6636 domain-containing protein n=1 Tax=Meiothermus sp. TaxID=1955249 RepID=UPI00298EDB0F|nr:DUF6636 domain-containing protein [Meiothermus sp.]MCS7068949.1 hypothetical protein [Meiothermus sp.]MDW8426835.1 hypothetical protein [Meiothermus sp.]